MLTRQGTQHLRTLLNLKAMLAEILQFLMSLGDGGGIDDQTRLRSAAGMGNIVHMLFIMNQGTFFLQQACEVAGGLVVTTNHDAVMDKVARNGTHTDATDSDEIYCFDVF